MSVKTDSDMDQESEGGCHLVKTNTSDWLCLADSSHKPLYCAIKTNNNDALKALIHRNVDLDERDQNGLTALHHAISSKHEFAIKLLLEKGCAKDVKTCTGQTPLHLAVKYKLISAVKLLLAHGSDISARDRKGNTVLHLVYKSKSFGKNDPIELVLQYVTDLHLGDSMVTLLVDEGADLNYKNNSGLTPLHIAVMKNRWSACLKLLNNNADVNVENRNNQSSLHMAAMIIDAYSVCRLLLERGCDVNKVDRDGNCALHYAAKRGDVSLIRLLVDKGADVRATNVAGQTALHFAVTHLESCSTTIAFLMQNKACIDAQDNDGNSPLHYAVQRCYTSDDTYHSGMILYALLAWLPDLQLLNKLGVTPLSRASGNFSESIFRHHIIKMQLAKMPVNIQYQFDQNNFLEFKESCLKELERLKHVYFGRNSLFKLFSMCDYSEYDVVSELKKAVFMINSESNFTIYGDLLKAILTRSVQRVYLINGALALPLKLPLFIVKNILSYLSNEDLENLIKTVDNSHCYLRPINNFMKRLMILEWVTLCTPVKTLPFLGLIQSHCIEELRCIFDKRPSELFAQDSNGDTYLHYCVYYSFKKGVSLLLEKGANINAKNNVGVTPLLCAIIDTHAEELLEQLLDEGADMYIEDDQGQNIMNQAIHFDRHSVVAMLIERGFKIDYKGKDGCVPVHSMFKWGNFYDIENSHRLLMMLSTCHILIDKTLKLNDLDNNQMTVLHDAMHISVPPHFLQMLLINGANVNCRSLKNITPLHLASYRSTSTVKYLIEHGADLNAQDDEGNTPLHCSVSTDDFYNYTDDGDLFNNTEVITMMIDNGASLFIENNRGVTPLAKGLCSDVRDHFVKCVIKLQCVNMLDGATNTFLSDRYKAFEHTFLEEVAKMKERKFGEDLLFDVFATDGPKHTSNEVLGRFISSPTLCKEFPNYCDLLKTLFNNAKMSNSCSTKTRSTTETAHDLF